MLTGNQLKAGRALLGMHQAELAERAGLNVNTIRLHGKFGRGAYSRSVREHPGCAGSLRGCWCSISQ